DHVEFYKRTRSDKVWVSWNETQGDGKDNEFLWFRECWKCLGSRLGLATEADARKHILTNARDYNNKKAKVDAFNTLSTHPNGCRKLSSLC
ncbi:MAG: hypothetical protein ACKPKO_10545, partial [Candidatus Fonsibacter sp.]